MNVTDKVGDFLSDVVNNVAEKVTLPKVETESSVKIGGGTMLFIAFIVLLLIKR